MAVKRTNHTVLIRVASHKSHGRGKIVKGHPAITERYPSISSPYFKRYAVGQFVVVKIKLSGKRRLIQWVRADEEVSGLPTFLESYTDDLSSEEDSYNKVHGLDPRFPSEESPPMPVTPMGYPTDREPGEEAESLFTKEMERREEELMEVAREEESKSFEPEILVDPAIDWTEQIYIREEDQRVLATLEKLSNKKHVAVMMIGPSGYGKTSIPQQKAQDWNMEFLRWDCATVRDPEEFFGFRGAVDGSTMTEEGETFFAESEFTKVVEAGNCIIVLDELNRIDPYISNILFPLLDHAGRTSVAGHEVVVGPNVMFFATVNLGFQFTGTFTLDTALTNRFAAKILVNALPSNIEEEILVARGGVNTPMAHKIVKLMQGLRGLNNKDQLSVDASTRVSIQISELVGAGLDLKSALVYVVINGISDEEAKLVIDQLGFVL